MARSKVRTKTASQKRSQVKVQRLLDGATRVELETRLIGAKESRTERVELRVTEREKLMIDRLKKQFDLSITELLVTLAKIASERVGLS